MLLLASMETHESVRFLLFRVLTPELSLPAPLLPLTHLPP